MPEIPVGFCQCGCGQRTKICEKSSARRGLVAGTPLRYLHGHHLRIARGSKNAAWIGGRIVQPDGYVRVLRPGHPRANQNGYLLEHVLVAETAMGRALPEGAEVHHVDENKQNNANQNLVVCQDHAYHKLLHRRLRALQECGDANALRCCICHQYDRQHDMTVVHGNGKRGRYEQSYHQSCNRAKQRRRRDASVSPREQEVRRSA